MRALRCTFCRKQNNARGRLVGGLGPTVEGVFAPRVAVPNTSTEWRTLLTKQHNQLRTSQAPKKKHASQHLEPKLLWTNENGDDDGEGDLRLELI